MSTFNHFNQFPKDIQCKVIHYAACEDLLQFQQCIQVCQQWKTYTMEDDRIWEIISQLLTTLRFTKSSLGSIFVSCEKIERNPFRKLCFALRKKKYLVMSNEHTAKQLAVVLREFGFKFVDFMNVDNLKEHQSLLSINQYDVVIYDSNEASNTIDMHIRLGDLLKTQVDLGMGLVLTLFTGCSWLESLDGAFRTAEYMPIIPQVRKNHETGSQQDGHFTLGEHQKDHFLFHNVPNMTTSYISLGNLNPKAKVIGKVSEIDKPMVVELEGEMDGRGTIVQFNVFWRHMYDAWNSVAALANGALYAALKSNRH